MTPTRKCSFGGCGGKRKAWGLCGAHYWQQRAGKVLASIHRRDPNKKCLFKNCKNEYRVRELCSAHYSQQQRGKPLTPIGSSKLPPLNPKEVPEQLRAAFDFNAQEQRKEKDGAFRWRIPRICVKCKCRKKLLVSRIRHCLKKGTLTGTCLLCCQPKGPANCSWKGGRIRTTQGYILAYAPDHPHATGTGYIPEHRLVMEKIKGRYLLPAPDETVHHKNGIRDNNRPENLELRVGAGSHPQGILPEDAPHCPTCVCAERNASASRLQKLSLCELRAATADD